GRKNPYIADLLHALALQPEKVAGIINSDIYLPYEHNWPDTILAAIGRNAVLMGQRADIDSLSDLQPRIYEEGFDFFFFEKNTDLPDLNRSFAMGLPWWDYWLPIAFAMRGLEIKLLAGPKALHLLHPAAWNEETWIFMALDFIEFAASEAPTGVTQL